ncbi:hypothetical protein EJP69_28690 [Variovorax gossypii]|uniref:Uncharacterized protein n=1 Tax=Variovorax gossypii TaxID=1679495 RepID=A0A431TDD8_9BURK|nr:hypothetical protein [Variovorax gossypii]RTQ30666.1 hypothetical protein EJP69_28690 [Variovorax gossypii]
MTVSSETFGAAEAPLVQRPGVAAAAADIQGWIVNTSIECDHKYSRSFWKLSLEEVLIAPLDDVRLLHEPLGGARSVPVR